MPLLNRADGVRSGDRKFISAGDASSGIIDRGGRRGCATQKIESTDDNTVCASVAVGSGNVNGSGIRICFLFHLVGVGATL